MVEQGAFREDLYYRLNVIPIHLPPLRERREDIPLLVRHFLERCCGEQTPPRGTVTVSQDAMRLLMSFAWPGNVRQLENTIERAVALSPGRSQIDVRDLPPDVQRAAAAPEVSAVLFPDAGIDFEAYVESIERTLIRQSLERTHGNKRQAAKLLNLKRTTLIEKLKRLERQ
jgi:two-component system, NtrC family, response regulator AtoC